MRYVEEANELRQRTSIIWQEKANGFTKAGHSNSLIRDMQADTIKRYVETLKVVVRLLLRVSGGLPPGLLARLRSEVCPGDPHFVEDIDDGEAAPLPVEHEPLHSAAATPELLHRVLLWCFRDDVSEGIHQGELKLVLALKRACLNRRSAKLGSIEMLRSHCKALKYVCKLTAIYELWRQAGTDADQLEQRDESAQNFHQEYAQDFEQDSDENSEEKSDEDSEEKSDEDFGRHSQQLEGQEFDARSRPKSGPYSRSKSGAKSDQKSRLCSSKLWARLRARATKRSVQAQAGIVGIGDADGVG